MRWTTAETDENVAHTLSTSLDVSIVMGRLMVQSGLTSTKAAENYLRPRLADLQGPFEIENLRAAVNRIEQAIEHKDSIVVFGDYDVDGITSTVQLVDMMQKFGLSPRFCVPLRLDEGYGLSREAIDRAFTDSVPKLFIAVDCGTNAHAQIAYLRKLGCDVIIIDHHQSTTEPPADCILVNPHVNDPEDVPWRELCTAGLVFKLLHGLLKSRRTAGDSVAEEIQIKDSLDLVAMGTIADLVPLRGENRILSWYGLKHLRTKNRPGIAALAKISGIDTNQEITSSDISFKIAPRINASGRLADAKLPIDLLLSNNAEKSRQIAEELDGINRERQTIQKAIVEEAGKMAEENFADVPGIVLFDKDWHPGVVGIVASQVSRRFHKPCVVLGAENHLAKGSGRSVASVNLVKIFEYCTDLLEDWGGHPMAAGVSLKASKVESFTQRYLEALRTLYPEGIAEPSLELSSWLNASDLNEDLLRELDHLQPFGQANREPVFGLKNIILDEAPRSFGKDHFRFYLSCPNGNSVTGVAWRMQSVPKAGQPIDMAIRFAWNYWRNSCTPQITLIDWRPSDPSQA